MYSKCTGTKKALCVRLVSASIDITKLPTYRRQIGINYRGQANQLYGCVNDARNVQNFLIRALYPRLRSRRLADMPTAQVMGIGRATQCF